MYIYASIYIYLVCYILLGIFYIIKYIFIVIFPNFLLGGMNGPPLPQEPDFHPGDDPFDPDVAILNHPIPAIV